MCLRRRYLPISIKKRTRKVRKTVSALTDRGGSNEGSGPGSEYKFRFALD